MPSLTARQLFAAEGLLVRHVTCDGLDGARPADEGADDARVIIVAQGRFAFQDFAGRGVVNPAAGLFLPDGHTYRIRHIDGGDACVAIQGDLVRALVDTGPVLRRVPTAGYLRVRDLAARLAHGETFTRLAIEEELTSALAQTRRAAPLLHARARSITDVIAHELEQGVDARVGLTELARRAGVSVFHACRVFKRVTGLSIHRYQQEVRLRHALAWLLETDHSIARIAIDAGFANQGHFTNVFRRRFNTTPRRVRAAGRSFTRRLIT